MDILVVNGNKKGSVTYNLKKRSDSVGFRIPRILRNSEDFEG